MDTQDIESAIEAKFKISFRNRQFLASKIYEYLSHYDNNVSKSIREGTFPEDNIVMVIGQGGREHAIVHKLLQSNKIAKIFIIPGNYGTEFEDPLRCINISNISVDNINELVSFAQLNKVSLVIVGPETPLVNGITDAMTHVNIHCFGPSMQAAMIEGSKAWSKEFMKRHDIPTASFQVFTNYHDAKTYIDSINKRIVIKASGLASGKGVIIPNNKEEEDEALKSILKDKKFGQAGDEVIIEDHIKGEEVSILAFCDGTIAIGMPPAQDHKRIYDNDQGKNTGGMGAYAPTPLLSNIQYEQCMDIVQKTVTCMKEEGIPYIGVLYAGFMIDHTANQPYVLEYNCRFGDPETQVLLPLLKSDLYDIVLSCTEQRLNQCNIQWYHDKVACTVVCASPGYPDVYRTGLRVTGIHEANNIENVKVYVSGAQAKILNHNSTIPMVITTAGRVLSVTGTGNTLKQAVDNAYRGVKIVSFEDMHYRKDIGKRGLEAPLRIGILGSARGTDMEAIIHAIQLNMIQATIAIVISNNAKSGILERAKSHNILYSYISSSNKSREEYDSEVSHALKHAGVDLVIMIGWMRIASSLFINEWRNRCINVHPSLLPDFAGGMDLDVHRAVLEAHREKSGCTVHFVTEQVDGGPMILQLECTVDPMHETPESLKRKVQGLEGDALVQSIQMFCSGEINQILDKVNNNNDNIINNNNNNKQIINYKDAGVNIEAGDTFVNMIKPYCKSTQRTGCNVELGGFGGYFDLSQTEYATNSLLVAGTDGVGTKLLVAQSMKKHESIGIDLVAMCVNDVLVCGAEPLFFLDYIATGSLDVNQATQIVKGITDGCRLAGAALIGGETAEMPGLYHNSSNEYDIAGFCVGAVKRNHTLPRNIQAGDVILGLRSSGIHSNGYSLVRKCMEQSGLLYTDIAPFDNNSNKTIGEILLTPTKIYVQSLLPLIKRELINGLAHITGGGILGNLPRILPHNITADIDIDTANWKLPPIFHWIREVSNISQKEMLRVFNCGIGMIVICSSNNVETVVNELISSTHEFPMVLGTLRTRQHDEEQVVIQGTLTTA